MSCLTDDLSKLTLKDLGQSAIFKILLGEIKSFVWDIYEDIDGCLEKPSSFSIINAVVDIYECSDLTTPIVTADPAVIDNTLTDKITITYSVDTTAAPLNVEGRYLLVLTYEKNNLLGADETYQRRVVFDILGLSCPEC